MQSGYLNVVQLFRFFYYKDRGTVPPRLPFENITGYFATVMERWDRTSKLSS